jgi:alcohol dehydrogenase (cytochrome c)
MYVTAADHVCALAAATGRELWCYTRPDDLPGSGGRRNSGLANRGVGLLGDRIFFATSDAHLLCLNRLTGGLMWEVNTVESPGSYLATSAPLVVGDLVITGMAGGDGPLRGFLAAYKAATGEQAWRFWTVPKPGEPGSETWTGNAIETGGGATWLTGSYDVETGTLYWAVGNPFPATDGDERRGSNLYTNCVIALDVKTGKLRWHYQFTPHDLHDWDATEPLVLVDTDYRDRPRKLLLQANRNGFVYVLDRTTGEFLFAKPFVKKMNWASGYSSDGTPQLLPANTPTRAGVKGCPSVRGATNWYSTAYNPDTRLFYVMSVEDCSIYRQSHDGGYEGYRNPGDPGLKYLRAIDIHTGQTVWEIPQQGPQEANYSGVLTTAGGLVFYGETGGGFAAVDAKTGKTLWTFHGNQAWRGCPMTYVVNGRQYVAVASGSNILSFALK